MKDLWDRKNVLQPGEVSFMPRQSNCQDQAPYLHTKTIPSRRNFTETLNAITPTI